MTRIHFGFGFWLAVISLLLVAGIIWGSSALQKGKVRRQEVASSRQVALSCTTDMATAFHIHPELSIVIDGIPENIPGNIGVRPTCMNALHTHDPGGIIHVESPVEKAFTLGDFFAVWGKDFSRESILGRSASTGNIRVSVNGSPVDTYENTVLHDKDKIVISYQSR